MNQPMKVGVALVLIFMLLQMGLMVLGQGTSVSTPTLPVCAEMKNKDYEAVKESSRIKFVQSEGGQTKVFYLGELVTTDCYNKLQNIVLSEVRESEQNFDACLTGTQEPNICQFDFKSEGDTSCLSKCTVYEIYQNCQFEGGILMGCTPHQIGDPSGTIYCEASGYYTSNQYTCKPLEGPKSSVSTLGD